MSVDNNKVDALFLSDARAGSVALQRGPDWLKLLVQFYDWWLKK